MVMGRLWSEEERAMAAAVLGPRAFEYLSGCRVSPEGVVAGDVDAELQTKLQEVVEGPSGRPWTYAIFWQATRARTGEALLVWGDGHCRDAEPRRRGSSIVARAGEAEREEERRQRMIKRVLQKLDAVYGCGDENAAIRLDRVTDAEAYFLISMYFSFPSGGGTREGARVGEALLGLGRGHVVVVLLLGVLRQGVPREVRGVPHRRVRAPRRRRGRRIGLARSCARGLRSHEDDPVRVLPRRKSLEGVHSQNLRNGLHQHRSPAPDLRLRA
uniref:Transcription factor n=1 Tax=Ananas comosus var. bracteatus TaxID=296719 RepID=A0A6V7P0H7_ANACO|nr:unnamed protein product [Ananas comosus var. bracteatus]